MTVDTVDTTKLWDLIKDIKFAMFTARHGDGQLHSRPMTTQNGQSERGGVLWFFMSRSRPSGGRSRGASRGQRDLCRPGQGFLRVDFRRRPRGRGSRAQEGNVEHICPGLVSGRSADPDLALVAVLIAEAEYWDVKSNQAVQLFKMARAAVTGKPPRNMGEHRRVRM